MRRDKEENKIKVKIREDDDKMRWKRIREGVKEMEGKVGKARDKGRG